jgi:hypothetical protein
MAKKQNIFNFIQTLESLEQSTYGAILVRYKRKHCWIFYTDIFMLLKSSKRVRAQIVEVMFPRYLINYSSTLIPVYVKSDYPK